MRQRETFSVQFGGFSLYFKSLVLSICFDSYFRLFAVLITCLKLAPGWPRLIKNLFSITSKIKLFEPVLIIIEIIRLIWDDVDQFIHLRVQLYNLTSLYNHQKSNESNYDFQNFEFIQIWQFSWFLGTNNSGITTYLL